MTHPRSEAIAKLNDAFRRNFLQGRVVMTQGVAALPPHLQQKAILEVTLFHKFNEDNDPHGERDFGEFDVEGHKLFWKIDYFDEAMKYHSVDPSDPTVTNRVLTIMLAKEY